MAETNRTERRLLDSIRRAKTGTENEGAPDATLNRSQGRATKSSSAKTRPEQGDAKTIPKTTATPAPSWSLTTLDKHPADCYQSSPRVWPD